MIPTKVKREFESTHVKHCSRPTRNIFSAMATSRMLGSTHVENVLNSDCYWFPGRWIGGTTMIVGPLLLLTGVLLRIQFHFFFPQQLAAFQEHSRLITASYSCFLAGNILMWPAVATIATLIGARRPGWALWGGTLVMFGLFARTFHAGVDHLAFQLVRVQDLRLATRAVADSYGAFQIVNGLTAAILFGWVVLAIGAYLSGTLGLVRSIALGLMSTLMIGVLKGSSPMSVAATGGLCVALAPLGIKMLRNQPRPSFRKLLGWALLIAAVVVLMFYFGQLG